MGIGGFKGFPNMITALHDGDVEKADFEMKSSSDGKRPSLFASQISSQRLSLLSKWLLEG